MRHGSRSFETRNILAVLVPAHGQSAILLVMVPMIPLATLMSRKRFLIIGGTASRIFILAAY
jgi:hypothetical protein